ncbi:GNAT family N-acetyltransferase [Streptomyces sp. ISL-12]|uniref:GNAT family N-acetyltransferase n=1 Tax=Streptomyces sp. ISL-12 TaxID=2819177 RepID=UPI001BE4E5B6|nr:GNAT family N-acetyltransferase [Streptomyces sp. ISL-12]MBT2411464.1 GNAT family N-acetyltransferase [Streptomyces sp. ISL-12]
MTLADCERVAEIRVRGRGRGRGRQHAYRGLIPQAYLDGLSIAEHTERRRARLTAAPADVTNMVARDDAGTVVGWGRHGPYRDDGTRTADAELCALYVDPRHLGCGAGRSLLGESVRRCAAVRYPRMPLWVLRGNTRARRFCERAGFGADGGEEAFEVAGIAVPEVRYARALTG